eukprot:gnl/TRDRNA2_/TRDRNA2_175651_c2_seq6.p1 gnl/TRDRNA2_/TRDRNA2_175651_c2~~gnl/TRDRNA2_/TRDRNA2_175651_c2_seq6.p1  ORF type:complete len:163 (+),score=30.17 gnl/TRDRNA2_/TRDRNA2_175651_c2_seq6:31-489(+)
MAFIVATMGTGVGAKRNASDPDGNVLLCEELEELDEHNMAFTYSFHPYGGPDSPLKGPYEGNAVRMVVKPTGPSSCIVKASGLPLASKSKEEIAAYKKGHTPFLEALLTNGKMEKLLKMKYPRSSSSSSALSLCPWRSFPLIIFAIFAHYLH